MFEKLIDRYPNVSADLSKQNRRDVATLMKRNGRSSACAIAKLLVRTALPHLNEAKLQQYCDDFGWLENGNIAHDLRDGNVLNPHKLRLELRLAVFEEHGNDFAKILVQFVKRGSLRMCTGEPGHEAHKQAGLRISFNYR